MACAEQLEVTCRDPFEQRHMRLNEIQIGAHSDAHQPRAFEVEIVLDPNFGIEHARDAGDEEYEDEPRGDARGDGAVGVSGDAGR